MTAKFMTIFAGAFLLTALSIELRAQTPQPSPPKVVTAVVAGQEVKMDYFAPSMRGRKIYGGLVPWNHVWCPGANWATTITVNAPFELGELKLIAGTYALWVLPNETEFELIVNSDAKAFHLNYNSTTDVGRMMMKLKKLDQPVEQLRFEVRPEKDNKATVALVWENTEASVPLTIN